MAHHDPLKALGPSEWSDVAQADLPQFLSTTFSQAQAVVDSIPTPASQARLGETVRARSHTVGSVRPPRPPPDQPGRELADTTAPADEAAARAALLQKEWKEVKVPAKDNPLAISIYKLASKDGRGAWFARRSLHEGIPFDKFQLGLEREFGESMKHSTGVGTGNVRGIGAERRAEHAECAGLGKAEVWVLSAQFPGPTAPRDFVTLLLTGSAKGSASKTHGLRQYMIVSKPCGHPECAPRTGYIRGSYESVEIIREVPVEQPLRRTRSSNDLQKEPIGTLDGQDKLREEALVRSASRRSARESEPSLPHSVSERPSQGAGADSASGRAMAVEWIMVTRSDPGGSVPRFMVEKGTPGGIINDAGRFLKWLATKKAEDGDDAVARDMDEEGLGDEAAPALPPRPGPSAAPSLAAPNKPEQVTTADDNVPPSGLYSIITGFVGEAASAVACHLPRISYPSGQDTDPTSSEESDSESDSGRSFASAPESATPLDNGQAGAGGDLGSVHSATSDVSSAAKALATQHEKQLKKLQDRYRKLEEKAAKQQDKALQQQQGASKPTPAAADDTALAKLQEKHARELARREASFRKEARKLEEKRRKEEAKAAARRRKDAEREARRNLTMELERTRVERDMARTQVDILQAQVGELQSLNTRLILRLGKLVGPADLDELLAGHGSGGNGVAGG